MAYLSSVPRILVLFFISFLTTVGCTPSDTQKESAPDSFSYRVVAYADGGTDAWKMSIDKITHINYSFANVNDEGKIFFRDTLEAARRLSRLQSLKARNPDLKLLVSVGGWGAGGFSDAALTKKSRTIFSKSAVEMIETYNLDGIDIDWEFPGQPGPGITFRPEDKQNFTLMLNSMRTHLDSLSKVRDRTDKERYLLTIASNDDQAYFDHTQMGKLHQYLDFINVMSYDMFTVGSATTGHHTGLYHSGPNAPKRTTDAAIQRHLEAGIPSRKIVLGAAFYGRSWQGVHPKNYGLYQTFEEFYQFIPYAKLEKEFINSNGFMRYWDEKANAPYLWNSEKQIMVSYDDPQSLRAKAAYIKNEKLGGVMYWHHSYDPSEKLLYTLYKELQDSYYNDP